MNKYKRIICEKKDWKNILLVECADCTGTIFSGKINEQEAIEAWNRRVNDERD